MSTTMMDPASSSDDDSSSCPSSEENQRRNGHDGQESEDSDDDDSDDGEDGARDARNNISNFDDLPTDDSEDESDSDSDDDGSVENQRSAGGIDGEGNYRDHDEGADEEEDVPLSERVASRAREGRRYYAGEDDAANRWDDGKKQRSERKSRAIELASDRLKEARKEGKGASKKHESDDSSDDESVDVPGDSGGEPKRKKSKHAPTEMSSARRDFFSRGRPDLNSSGIGVSIGANRYRARDPRMVSLSGHLDADVFERRYAFLDGVQDEEIDRLKKRVSAWKKSGKKGQKERRKLGMTQGGGSAEEDQEEMTRLLQERAERNKAKVVRGAKQVVKKKMRDDLASGKRGAYYPKRSELRRMEGEAKYEEIRKQGGNAAIDKAIEKRRKKNVSKASKRMPSHMVS